MHPKYRRFAKLDTIKDEGLLDKEFCSKIGVGQYISWLFQKGYH